MRTLNQPLGILCLCLFLCKQAASQDISSTADKVINFPASFLTRINNKSASLEEKLTSQTEKYLQRLAKQEEKLQRKLAKVDSSAAKKLFANSAQQYGKMMSLINTDATAVVPGKQLSSVTGQYLPYVDSMKGSLSFLSQNSSLLTNSKELQGKLQGSLQQVNQLQSKLQQTEQVKAFIQQRKQQIKEALAGYTNLPPGISNSFKAYNQQAYYYSAQVKEYKDLLNDPDKMLTQGLSLLNKLPAFTSFMQQHGELASLFSIPANYGTMESVAGLQTRTMVMQQVQAQLATGGPGAQQYLQQSMQAAQTQLNQFKDKLSKLGGNSGDIDMPDFKPNEQKTKTFWKRLEYGTNIQTTRSGTFFPTTTDIGLSIGYKLSGKSTIGIGASYKVGWGTDIKHISITQQGMGLRSFLDIKLKGSFYASGGFEYNYQPLSPEAIASVTSVGKWSDPGAWSRSGLIGISKIVSVKSNFFKKTKLQLLWDFLSYQQVPQTQPFKFRVGYNF